MSKWKNVILNDVADVLLSNVDKKTNEGERIVKLCNYTDVYKNSYISFNKTKSFMVATCNENEFSKFELKRDQVAITKDSEKRDDIGISTYISEDLENIVLGYHTALVTPKENKLSGRFLNYWFNTKLAKEYFENNAGGSGQRCTLPIDIIRSIPIVLPTYNEQLEISSILFNLDSKIELNNRINAELEQMAKTIYDYWFVQFDFPVSAEYAISVGQPELEGKPYKSSGGKMVWSAELKRDVPEGWEVKSLFNVCNVQYGYPFSTEFFNTEGIGKPVIRIRDILENSISNYSSQPEIDTKYEIKIGDILIGMDGNFHINYWSKKNCFLNQRVVKLSETLLPSIFLKYQVEPFIQLREKSVSRTTVGHLSDKDLKSIKVLVPPSGILNKIQILYKNLLDQILNNNNENQKLTELRDWLLPMLMNGQVNVGDVVDEEMMGMAAEALGEYKVRGN